MYKKIFVFLVFLIFSSITIFSATLKEAENLYVAGKYDKALTEFKKIVEDESIPVNDRCDAYMFMAEIYKHKNNDKLKKEHIYKLILLNKNYEPKISKFSKENIEQYLYMKNQDITFIQKINKKIINEKNNIYISGEYYNFIISTFDEINKSNSIEIISTDFFGNIIKEEVLYSSKIEFIYSIQKRIYSNEILIFIYDYNFINTTTKIALDTLKIDTKTNYVEKKTSSFEILYPLMWFYKEPKVKNAIITSNNKMLFSGTARFKIFYIEFLFQPLAFYVEPIFVHNRMSFFKRLKLNKKESIFISRPKKWTNAFALEKENVPINMTEILEDVYVTGFTKGRSTSKSLLLVKFGKYGWRKGKYVFEEENSIGKSIISMSDNHVLVNGTLIDSNSSVLIKLNNKLEEESVKKFDKGIIINHIISIGNNTYIACGFKETNSRKNIILYKFNENLEEQMFKEYNLEDSLEGLFVIQTEDKGFLILGRNSEGYAILLKTKSDGSID